MTAVNCKLSNVIMKTIAVIPAYNEAPVVGGVVKTTLPFVDEVFVVDDGSHDETGARAREAGARIFTHTINRGLGATLGTGIAAALAHDADVIVTLDADGQHDPAEIPKLTSLIARGIADAVLGSRLLDATGMPFRRRLFNHMGSLLTFFMFGMYVTDTQSGFRAFSRDAAERVQIRSNRMEVSSEIVAEIRRQNIRVAEVPIRAIYTEYSLSKGQNFRVGLKTAYKLLFRRFGR